MIKILVSGSNRLIVNDFERKYWLDVLRCFAILFVLYGHILKPTDNSYIYYVFTSPIKIPLFLTISGYLFKDNMNFMVFFKKITKGLITPWLVLSLVPIFMISIFKGYSWLMIYLTATITGKRLWYMPCCILAEIIFYLSLRYCYKKNSYLLVILTTIVTFVGIKLTNLDLISLFMFNRAMSVQLFLLFGYFMKKYWFKLINVKETYFVILYFMLGFLSIYLYPGQCLDAHLASYYNLPICMFMIFTGCLALFIGGARLKLKNPLFVFIGQNTLVYYIWASYPAMVYSMLTSRFKETLINTIIKNNFLSALIETIFICVICGVLSAIVNFIAPEIVGKRKFLKSTKSCGRK